MSEKINYGYMSLSKAISKLEQFVRENEDTERDHAVMIQAFEFCFELSWKYIQKLGSDEGEILASPKRALIFGADVGYILDRKIWADMLSMRNRSVHTYNEEVALEISTAIKARFLAEFLRIREAFKKS